MDHAETDDAAIAGELTPDAVWAALRASAERNSPFDREIDRRTSELRERGILHSGLAVQSAHELAYDYGLVWDKSLGRFIDRAHATPELSNNQRHAVEAAGQHFAAAGEWPKVADIVRDVARRGLSTDTRQAVHSLPPVVGYESDQKLVLTAEGLALSGHGTQILQTLVEFARMAAAIYLGDDDPPIITNASVTAVGHELRDRLNAVLETERFLVGSGHDSGDGWVWEVAEHAVRFRDCTTIDEYLALRRGLLMSRVHAAHAVTPPPAPSTATKLVDLDDLHPAIRDAVADLVIAGCVAEAVLPACMALAEVIRSGTGLSTDGTALAEEASSLLTFGGDLDSKTGRNIHRGTKLLLEGLMLGVRNIFAHHRDRFPPEEPAELIALCSLLARRVEHASVVDGVAHGDGAI